MKQYQEIKMKVKEHLQWSFIFLCYYSSYFSSCSCCVLFLLCSSSSYIELKWDKHLFMLSTCIKYVCTITFFFNNNNKKNENILTRYIYHWSSIKHFKEMSYHRICLSVPTIWLSMLPMTEYHCLLPLM